MLTKASLIEKLRQAGAIRVGFAPLAPVSDAARDHYLQWLAQGRHASMQYLEHHLPIRFNPALLLTPNQPSTPAASQASSLASQASPLASQTSPLASQASPLASQACRGAPAPEEGTIISMAFPYYSGQAKGSGGLLFARYALGDDYHEVLRRRLQPVAEAITAATGCPARICIDTAPIMERFWAIQAGLGYIGRHRQLIIPGIGSHIFLAEIVTTAPFPPRLVGARYIAAAPRRPPRKPFRLMQPRYIAPLHLIALGWPPKKPSPQNLLFLLFTCLRKQAQPLVLLFSCLRKQAQPLVLLFTCLQMPRRCIPAPTAADASTPAPIKPSACKAASTPTSA